MPSEPSHSPIEIVTGRAAPSEGRFEARPLPYIACVSWPRSGHHVLVRALQKIFKFHFGYCSFYGPAAEPGSGCCGEFPCKMAGPISMSKQHDFDLKAELPNDHPLVVQYRKFSDAVVSEFELFVRESPGRDDAATFKTFAVRRAKGYALFIEKWVRSDRENRVLLDYADLVDDPFTAIRSVLRLYDARVYVPRIESEIALLAHQTVSEGKAVVAEKSGIAELRDVRNFRFYDEELFASLEKLASRTPAEAKREREERRERRRKRVERRPARRQSP